jgi:hypothetical protein
VKITHKPVATPATLTTSAVKNAAPAHTDFAPAASLGQAPVVHGGAPVTTGALESGTTVHDALLAQKGTPVRTLTARVDDTLHVRVLSRVPLLYTHGADASLDRPGHVRAGSGCTFVDAGKLGRRLAVVQDDTNFIAFVDVKSGRVDSLALPAIDGQRQFDKSRGNKNSKLDLEAVTTIQQNGKDALLGLGSGSLPVRETLVVVTFEGDEPKLEILNGHKLYEALRNKPGFAGDELNLEGLALIDGGKSVRLFQRGNGVASHNGFVDVELAPLLKSLRDPSAPLPPLSGFTRVELGTTSGTRLTFTDGKQLDAQRTAYLAAAEASPNAIDDGEVVGCALGVLDDSGAHHALIHDEHGKVLCDKTEGLAFDEHDPSRAYVVVDKDDAAVPSELLVLSLEGL